MARPGTLCIATVTVLVILAAAVQPGAAQVPCFDAAGCGGNETAVNTARECCLGSGLSFRDGGTCRQCIVHGFVRTTDLELNEGTTQEVIRMTLDIKGNTLVEPASTQVLNFGFSFTCIYSSNGDGPQAVDRSDFTDTGCGSNIQLRLFPSAQRRSEVGINAVADDKIEGTEVLILRLVLTSATQTAINNAGNIFFQDTLTIRVIDVTAVVIGFSEDDYTGDEGEPGDVSRPNTPCTVTVEIIERSLEIPLQIRLTPGEQNATRLDFNDTVITTRVPVAQTQLVQAIEIFDDEINEGREVFNVSLEVVGNISNAVEYRIQTTLCRIRQSDPIEIGFTRRRINVTEVRFQQFDDTLINKSRASEQTFTAQVEISTLNSPFGQSATRGEDFQTTALPDRSTVLLELAPSQPNTIFSYQIIGDDIPENQEVFQLSVTPEIGSPTFTCTQANGCFQQLEVVIVDDDPVVVGFVDTLVEVNETDGQATLDVNITVPGPEVAAIEIMFSLRVDSIDGSAASYSAIDTLRNPIPGFEDFPRIVDGIYYTFQEMPFDIIESSVLNQMFNEAQRSQTFTFPIFVDDVPEGVEELNLTLSLRPDDQLREGAVSVTPAVATVRIRDFSPVVVGFERSLYIVGEEDGQVELCVNITVPRRQDIGTVTFNLTVETQDGSADFPSGDYENVSMTLGPFTSQQPRQCFNVPIINDTFIESNETFTARLTLIPASVTTITADRITIDPPETTVLITDNDLRIVVGYVRTNVTVRESDGVATLTVAISMPPEADPIETSFYLLVNTMDGSATEAAPGDYGGLTNYRLGPFSNDVRQLSFNVSIVNDNITEDSEMFRAMLTLENADQADFVTVSPDEAIVTINDTDEITVGYTVTDVTVLETDGIARLTVSITMPSEADLIDTSFFLLVNTFDGTATAPGDYGVLNNFRLGPFNRSIRQLSFDVPIVNDNITEDAETFTARLTLDPADQARLGNRVRVSPDVATVTINDTDEITVGYTVTDVTVLETDGVARLTVSITMPSEADLIDTSFFLLVNTFDGTATAPGDYGVLNNFRLGPFNSIMRQLSFDVSIVNDNITEDAETFTARLTLDPADQARLGNRVRVSPDVATVTINDTDEITVGYTVTDVTVLETDGVARLTVSITMPSEADLIDTSFFLLVNTFDGTATAPGDYGGLNNFRLGPFNSSMRQLSFDVPIVNDNITEDAETFTASLTLDPADQARLGNRVRVSPDVATVTINDTDEITVGYTVTDVTVLETDGVARLTVSITMPSEADLIDTSFFLLVNTFDGTATAPGDYGVLNNFRLGPFNSIMRQLSFDVPIVNDNITEDAETFTARLTLDPADQARLGNRVRVSPDVATVTINDTDEITVGYTVTDVTILETDGVARLTVTITMPSEADLIDTSFFLLVNTFDGTATAPGDYGDLNNFRLGPFSSSMRQLSFNVPIVNDNITEDAETFTARLTLDPADQARLGNRVRVSPDVATVTIQDNDEITVGYTVTDVTVLETDGVARLTVAITMPSEANLIDTSFFLLVNTFDGTATAPGDYGVLNNFRLGPFNSIMRQLSFDVPIVNDNITEDAETFTARLTLDPADQARLGNRVRVSPDVATVTINDTDEITVGYTVTDVTVLETDGVARLTVAITMPSEAELIDTSFFLLVNTFDGTATAPGDYGDLNNFRLGPFSSSMRQLSFDVPIVNDNITEDAETFSARLTLDPADQARLGNRVRVSPDVATVTIQDDDGVVVGFVQRSYSEDENVGTFRVCVAVTMPLESEPLERMFTLRVSTRPGTAGNNDFIQINNQDVGPFSNVTRQQCFSVEIINDTIREDMESFFLDLTTPVVLDRVNINPAVTEVIINDDDEVTVEIEELRNLTVTEGPNVTVERCVVISGSDPIERSNFNVCVSTMDGTAMAGQDYVPVSNMPLGPFGSSNQRQCFNIIILDDTQPENSEDFTVSVHPCPGPPPPRVIFNPRVGRNTIEDDDPVEVGFEQPSYTEDEGVGQFNVCVVVTVPPDSVPLDRMFFLSVSTRNGTAGTNDFTPINNQSLGPFSNAIRQQCFSVVITDDMIREDTENFFLNLTTRPGEMLDLVTISPDEAEVTINDNDRVTIGIEEPTDRTVMEGVDSTVQYCVVISAPDMTAPMERSDFNVCVSTVDGTAMAGQDYQPVTNLLLGPFGDSNRRQCFNVSILDGLAERTEEDFMVNVQFCPGQPQPQNVDIDPSSGTTTILDADDVLVGFQQTSYTTDEDGGGFSVCVVVFRPLSTQSLDRTFSLRVSTRPGTAGTNDFTSINNQDVGPFSNMTRRQCFAIEITNDMIREEIESFFLDLTTPVMLDRVIINPAVAEVIINEDDQVTVEIEELRNRTVTEGPNVTVERCVVIPGSDTIDRNFNVCVSTMDGTAMAGQDYVPVTNMPLGPFGSSNRRQCFNITILDDTQPENSEDFTMSVHSCPDSPPPPRIIFNPRVGHRIEDDDPVEVGFEPPSYTEDEGVGQFNVCVVVTVPPNSVSLDRMFFLSVSTRPGTAGTNDFTPINNQSIGPFSNAIRQQCFSVVITDDMIREDTENFFLDLTTRPGETLDRVNITSDEAEVTINDNDRVRVGIEEPRNRTVMEGTNSTVEYCVVITGSDPIERSSFNVCVSTMDGTAMAPQDYDAVMNMILGPFDANNRRQCFNVNIRDDTQREGTEDFTVSVDDCPGPPPPGPRIIFNPRSGRTTIIDNDVRPPIRVNDTVTGDPLMTVPLNVGNETRMLLGLDENERVSLCYEVHGEANENFNLVSDVCVSVNARYARVRSDVDINVIDQIGVRAMDNASRCHNIMADLNGCSASVDGVEITTSYRMGGISVRKYPTRVRIAVPNCEDHDLVMWVFCQTGSFENGNMTFDAPMIRYVIARGFNLAERSHGILGQFWNIPINVVQYSQPIDGVVRSDTYTITVNHPGQRRQFVGFLYPLTWEFEENQCLYVGNGQGGPIDEVDDPNDPVLYGEYTDYKVDSIFGTEFDYDHFQSSRCSPAT